MSWLDDAACRGLPWQLRDRIFYPERGTHTASMYAEARTYCDRCPVTAECLQAAADAFDTDHGFWGGKTPRERKEMRARGLLQPSPRRCDWCFATFTPRPQHSRRFCTYECGVSYSAAQQTDAARDFYDRAAAARRQRAAS